MKAPITYRGPGERIRQRRLQQGYSQENMADLLNLSTTAYGDIERGKTELTLTRLGQIATALNCSTLDLLTDDIQVAHPVEVAGPRELETLRLTIEKQQIELEKLRLEAEHWKRRHDERVMLELARALGTEKSRERIGF